MDSSFYFGMFVALTAFFCLTHVDVSYPDKSFKPHRHVGNIWKAKKKEREEKEARESRKRENNDHDRPGHRNANRRFRSWRSSSRYRDDTASGGPGYGISSDRRLGASDFTDDSQSTSQTPDQFENGGSQSLLFKDTGLLLEDVVWNDQIECIDSEMATPANELTAASREAIPSTQAPTLRDDFFELPSRKRERSPPDEWQGLFPDTNNTAAKRLKPQHFHPSPRRKKPFNLLYGLLRHPAILTLVVSSLMIPDIIKMYAISKAFHYIFNWHYTNIILACARTWAPRSELIYPWRFYKDLCIKDPALRQKASWRDRQNNNEPSSAREDLRDVPSLRWLQMVIWRYGVCKDILIQLATHGLRCLSGTLDAVRRMWFVMDLPSNALRIGVITNPTYFADPAIIRLVTFLLKVDMLFTEPNGRVFPAPRAGEQPAFPVEWAGKIMVGCDLRELLLNERQLTSLWRCIRGWTLEPDQGPIPLDRFDILRLYVRHHYRLPGTVAAHVRRQSILGIPWWQVGTGSYERSKAYLEAMHAAQHNQPLTYQQSIFFNDPLLTHEAFYPHRRRLSFPSVLLPRRLLRPDDLLVRESIRRRMRLHQQLARFMFWGFCDEIGRNYAELTEKELLEWSHGKRPPDDRVFVGLTPRTRFRRGRPPS